MRLKLTLAYDGTGFRGWAARRVRGRAGDVDRAGTSMAYSEGLSDTGELTGRGRPLGRGLITGVGTFIGGILHTLPFLIPHYQAAVVTAAIVVAFELVALAAIRWRFFETSFVKSLGYVTLGGAVIALAGATIGTAA